MVGGVNRAALPFVVVILPGGLLDLMGDLFPNFSGLYLRADKPIDAPKSITSGKSGSVRIQDLELKLEM